MALSTNGTGKAIVVPVTTEERVKKPPNPKFVVKRGRDPDGNHMVRMRAAPGYAITEAIFIGLDGDALKNLKAHVGLIVEKRRGRGFKDRNSDAQKQ